MFESKAIPQANPEDDGTEGLYGYHNDGCMDIIHLVQYIKNQVELYTDYRNEGKPPVTHVLETRA